MTLILYHAKWCGHCKTFMGKDGGWEKLKQMRNRGFKLKAIEENKISVTKKKKLLGFPTIELQTNMGTKVYKGDSLFSLPGDGPSHIQKKLKYNPIITLFSFQQLL